jgi:hypothetical protein
MRGDLRAGRTGQKRGEKREVRVSRHTDSMDKGTEYDSNLKLPLGISFPVS